MNTELIQRMQSRFDDLAQTHPEEEILEFWFARDLQEPLGYARRENFLAAVRRAIESCKSTDCEPEHHFRGVTKLIIRSKSGQREIEDSMFPFPEWSGHFHLVVFLTMTERNVSSTRRGFPTTPTTCLPSSGRMVKFGWPPLVYGNTFQL